jgi:hypothetical protein
MVPSPSDEVAGGGRKKFSPPNAGGGDTKSERNARIVSFTE